MKDYQKSFCRGNEIVINTGVLAVMTGLLLFFLISGIWFIHTYAEVIHSWRSGQTRASIVTSQMDTIRYALIMYRMEQGDYPDSLSENELESIIRKNLNGPITTNDLTIIHYEHAISIEDPTFTLIISHRKNKITYKITPLDIEIKD